MFEEIDYILEAQNAERFASLYACSSKCLPDIAFSSFGDIMEYLSTLPFSGTSWYNLDRISWNIFGAG